MKKYYYDLHIHSALSPCGGDDMTPQNIVGMAQIAGLDIIAVCDHNSAGNVRSVAEAAKEAGGPLVVPAIELTTSEEIHVLLLFRTVDGAEAAWREIRAKQMKIKNKTSVFGHEFYMDAQDNITGEEENLLIVAVDISADDTPGFAAKYGGIAIPAHADKPSNAMIAILGDIPEETGFTAVELTGKAPPELQKRMQERGYHILSDSDSHVLGIMNDSSDEKNTIELPEPSVDALIDALSKKIRNR